MWAGIARAMLYGFSALGVADIFGLGDDSPSKSLWSNPLVIIGLLLTLILVLNNLSKLQLINK
tara:strand:- start:2001 stop:2189 length:189 start_codon:yes stop_codon:yes gene_type:complete